MSLLKRPGRTLSQPGLELVFHSHDGPQVVQPEKEAVQRHWSAQQPEEEVADPFVQPDEPPSLPIRESQTPRRTGNLPRKVLWMLVLALALFATGLGFGLGVGLQSQCRHETLVCFQRNRVRGGHLQRRRVDLATKLDRLFRSRMRRLATAGALIATPTSRSSTSTTSWICATKRRRTRIRRDGGRVCSTTPSYSYQNRLPPPPSKR